jgi:hypothetical protein
VEEVVIDEESLVNDVSRFIGPSFSSLLLSVDFFCRNAGLPVRVVEERRSSVHHGATFAASLLVAFIRGAALIADVLSSAVAVMWRYANTSWDVKMIDDE